MLERKALVISADPQVKAMLVRILEPKQWTVQDAASNATALQLVEKVKFDLILTGEKTSGQEDVQLLRRIRRIHPHTRVIILTEETTSPDVVAAIREGAFSFFSKPFCLESLTSIVQQVTDGPCWDDGIEIVSATPEWIRLLARCDLKTADRLLQFFHEIIDLPDQERESVAIAFREMLLNAIEHGANFSPEQFVEISYLRTRRAVSCRIKDPGEGFRLDAVPHAAVANPTDDPLYHMAYREAKNLRPGGFGVLLTRNTIDELVYNEQGNEVVLIKYIDRVGS
jgi:CheY-like chemotaxis protein